ncbi:MAG: hypothetical protein HYZ53_10755 [Planctomycetes bacterium]|nr:hypothetical protein [Planctomycetota bacterium]
MTRIAKPIAPLACATWALTLLGCAVATVDVDVYKGPLANHKDVQTEQAAAMAMGAKPLLLALRNRSEWPAGNTPPWVEDDFMPQPAHSRESRNQFRAELAIRVNAILSLYKDQAAQVDVPPSLKELLRRGQREWNAYERSLGIFVTDRDRDARLWERYVRLFQKAQQLTGTNAISSAVQKNPTLATIRNNLFLAYKDFLYPDHTKRRELDPLFEQLRLLCLVQPLDTFGTDGAVRAAFDIPPENASANLKFDFLQKREVLEIQVALLFPDHVTWANGKPVPGEAARDFVDHVARTARAFTDARGALDQLLESALDFIWELNSPENMAEVGEHATWTLRAAQIAASLVHPHYLGAALQNTSWTGGSAAGLLAGLAHASPSITPEDLRYRNAVKEKAEQRNRLRESLVELLTREPRATAEQMKAAHATFRDNFAADRASPEIAKLTAWYSPEDTRRYGLVYGPLLAGEDSAANVEHTKARVEEIARSVSQLASLLTGAGLDEGRLPDGLETLINQYLKSSFDLSPSASKKERAEVARKRDRLLSALINFAEKILFMVNNDFVPQTGRRSPSDVDPGRREDRTSGSAGATRPKREVRDYLLLVQAVGNSIFTLVDELRQRRDHDERPQELEDAAEEARAQRRAFEEPGAELARFVQSLQEETQRLAALYARIDELQAKKKGPPVPVGAELARMDRELTDLEARKPTDGSRREKLQKALEQATSLAGETLARVTARPGDARSVYDELLRLLSAKAGSEADATPKTDYTSTIQVVTEYRNRAAFVASHRPSPGERKQVLDDMIANLRYEHIKATSEGNAARAKRLAAAIELSYAYRSGMTYLRPASSYLRTSTPATSLQNAAPILWNNLLGTRFLLAAVPFSDVLFKDDDDRLKVEIDKQFWQSVNRIRVSGTGNTNYVIAKDDIGNWYVKNYSTDVKDIVRSAKNLASFALGPRLRARLPIDRGQTATATGAQPPAEPPDLSPASAQFKQFNTQYGVDTTALYRDLVQKRENLPAAIASQCESAGVPADAVEKTRKFAAEVVRPLRTDASVNPTTAPNTAADVMIGLRTLLRNHAEVTAKLRADPNPSTAVQTEIQTAVDRVFRDILEELVGQRRKNMENYEWAITNLGAAGEVKSLGQ